MIELAGGHRAHKHPIDVALFRNGGLGSIEPAFLKLGPNGIGMAFRGGNHLHVDS
jgi:hypothetical protein